VLGRLATLVDLEPIRADEPTEDDE
jgi:hypothetical protein